MDTQADGDDESLSPFEVHRIKGRIPLDNGRLMLLQGVREVFELTDAAEKAGGGDSEAHAESENDGGKIVVIGRGLRRDVWQRSLEVVLQT